MEISSLERAFGLADRRALITGGGSGLGFAIARCMISAGARVIITGRTADTLSRAAEELGNAVEWQVFDVTDTAQTGDFAEKLLAQGPVDILVNNAGIHCKKPMEEISVEEFNAVLNVHLMGAFRLTQAFIPAMRKNHRGVILFISSMSGHIGLTKVAAYSAAKSGVLGLTHTLASELAVDNIRVNAITPGFIDTPMFRKVVEGDVERKKRILERTPMNHFGTPEDIGWAAVYLASGAAGFVNGATLVVDGGALIGF